MTASIRYTPQQIVGEVFGPRTRWQDLDNAARAVARWAARNLTRECEDCPECGAVEDVGDLHGDACEHNPAFGHEGTDGR